MMRPFLPIVLLCAACGDNLIVETEEEGPPVEEPGFEEPYSRFVPDVCSVRTWPTVAFQDRDVDLSVVPTLTGAAIFTVDRAGGPLRGFAINGRGELETKEHGTDVRDDRTFTAVSAAFIDERLITAAVSDDGSIAIDMIRPDLGEFFNLDTVRGTVVADVPMAHARADRLATVGDDKGLTAIRFDTDWQTAGTEVVGAGAPQSMTATRYLTDTMVAWSTDSTCSLLRVAADVLSTRSFPCLDGRIAIDSATRRGFMVFEDAGQVMISDIRVGGESEIANRKLLVDAAHAPKIVFDGSRFWVSYVNQRLDVVVGYLGSDGTLVSMALEGTQPMPEAYELAVINGSVWVFAVDGVGANAQRLCLKAVR